ncbi:metallophosphoesterase family protein [uncultured Pseudodesulfovibrio sp.]|uniref:metallophosphoesterase family protein n=1 Tax=uncultured Pseudodesulfovibrio sp. TaxID=2035858 RepID=UPI0029C718DA|nr:metallophosphoesterase family protein [uncultured Pseudodesulfovibrio sp.]
MIALISDIHGNYTALKEVLKEIDLMGIDTVYCLGDVVGYYSQVNECCEELRKRGIVSVMGNHDWYIAARSFCPRSQSVNDCLAYQRTVISEQNLQWLRSFPVFMTVGDLSMVHGGWTNPVDEYLDPSEEYFARVEGKYFASGHVHRQFATQYGDKVYCNPGSVGQPRDDDPKAAFATFDGENFFLHRVEYDIIPVGELMEEAGFSGYYYGCLRTGSKKMQW